MLFETVLSHRPIPLEIKHVFTTICLHLSRKAHMTCNFNCLIETEGRLKVTSSQVQCKHGKISETMRVAMLLL